ncbi:MAG: 50S ribosomal protein L9 [Chloroflexi bacterium]|nr:50S ribosomal protein L9 [Chloroflexota bacterium]
MEVILLRDVKGLGDAGQVKNVAPGYARNYLIPRNLAVAATGAARKQIAQQAAAEARRAEEEKAHAEEQAAKHSHVELQFTARAGETGRLYGSITNGDIAERLSAEIGESVDKRKVELEEPIKELGTTDVEVKLHPGVTMTVHVVVQAEDEAD